MKIKIIELLVKTANKEEIPKKIKYSNKIWKLEEHNGDYKNEDTYLFEYLFKYFNTKSFINNKAEITEENKEIEKLEFEEGKVDDKLFLAKYITHNRKKINELIDEINKMKEGK